MSLRLMVLPFVILFSTGCAATSATLGKREPNLGAIAPGATRWEVERTLGRPSWRAGTVGDLTFDIYEYEVARKPNLSLGLAGFAVDVLTLGLTELMAAGDKVFAPAKQVAVAYDERSLVQSVSTPWRLSEGLVGPARRMRSVIPAEGDVHEALRTPPVAQQAVADPPVAVLVLRNWGRTTVDGQPSRSPRVELPPGRHTVEYSATLGTSIHYGTLSRSYQGAANVDLLPGRHYRSEHKRLKDFLGGLVDIFWIEDDLSREVLYCSWP